jgi:hypothetical protein
MQVAAPLALAAVNPEKVDEGSIYLQLHLGLLIRLLGGDYDDAVALYVHMTTLVPHFVPSPSVVLLDGRCTPVFPPAAHQLWFAPIEMGHTALFCISSAMSSQATTGALLSWFVFHDFLEDLFGEGP